MTFIASPKMQSELWDYIQGDIYTESPEHGPYGLSISTNRYYYLHDLYLESEDTLKVSLRDPENNRWTKWKKFPGKLLEYQKSSYGREKFSNLTPAIDVHRSVLPNEIVIESDYPNYEDNYDASRIIGAILEHKGFSPLYYYSGSKSIHIHVYFQWNCLRQLNPLLKQQLSEHFRGSLTRFKKKFITWLREMMISCWGTKAREFDTNLVRATHLIRAELSRNKRGFKTFIGFSYKDLSFVPYICNEENRIYPKLGTRKLSVPKDVNGLLDEFYDSLIIKKRKKKVVRKNRSLSDWVPQDKELRNCVSLILSKEFIEANDGRKRGVFILANELKRVYGEGEAKIILQDWNSRLIKPLSEEVVDQAIKNKLYNLSDTYITNFLKEFGIKCERKV